MSSSERKGSGKLMESVTDFYSNGKIVQVLINMGLGKFLNSLNTKLSVCAQQLNEISTSYFRVGLLQEYTLVKRRSLTSSRT